MSESDLFPDIDPGDPIPENAEIVRYMSLHALMMLLMGQVFIPSIKKLQEMDPLESLLPSVSIPDFPERCLRLPERENAEWLRKQSEKYLSELQTENDLVKIWGSSLFSVGNLVRRAQST